MSRLSGMMATEAHLVLEAGVRTAEPDVEFTATALPRGRTAQRSYSFNKSIA